MNPIFSSHFLTTKELHNDFNMVGYRKLKRDYLFFLCFTTFEIIILILVGNYDLVGVGLFISFLMTVLYFGTQKRIAVNYEREIISAGKDRTLRYELFDDKIVVTVEGRERDFFYDQITKLYETKQFLLLHLKHQLYITIEKSSLNGSPDEVKAFLLTKCTQVKKKKFIDCSNDKKWSLIFLIALIVVSVIGCIVGYILKFSAPF